MSAYSLACARGSIAITFLRTSDALLPLHLKDEIRGFGIMLYRQSFSAQDNSMSKLLRIF